MCLFNLIEENHTIWTFSHPFAERSALLIAHISGRCSNQLGNGMLFHVFRHIKPDQAIFIIKQMQSGCFRQSCLTNTGWTCKQKASNWAVFLSQSCSSTNQCSGKLPNCRSMSDNLLLQLLFQRHQSLLLSSRNLLHGNPNPHGNDFRKVGFCHHRTGNMFLLAANPSTRTGFIQQINCFIRQIAVVEVANRTGNCLP